MEQIIKRYTQLIEEIDLLINLEASNTGNTGIEKLNNILIKKRFNEIHQEIMTLRDNELNLLRLSKYNRDVLFKHVFNTIEVREQPKIIDKIKINKKKGTK